PKRDREYVAQRAADGQRSRLRVHHFHLGVPRLRPIRKIKGEDSDADRLNDVFVEFLQALIGGDALLQGGVESGVLDSNADISGQSLKEFDILAREIVALDRLTHTQHGNSTVLDAARDVVVQFQLRNRRLRCGAGVQHLVSVFEEEVSGLALIGKPTEEIKLQIL